MKKAGRKPSSQKQTGRRKKDLSPASRVATEQMLRDVHHALEGKNFKSIGDLNAFMETLSEPGGLSTASRRELTAKEEAQDLAWEAIEVGPSPEALRLAQAALKKDPDCVDALLIEADLCSSSAEDRLMRLRKAVEAGERSLGAEFFRENKGHFWLITETRPYMRARIELSDALYRAGQTSEAIHHCESILELNPNDNQGLRYVLLGYYLAADMLDGARRLLQADESSTFFNWGRTLERYLSGDLKAAARELKRARKDNRFVERYLTGATRMPSRMPDGYTWGGEEEAVICADLLRKAWVSHPHALDWLKAQVAKA